MSRVERIVLSLAVFLAGGLLMSLEVAAFRIIGRSFGSALRETTTVIAVFLTAMSIGYWVGGRVGDRRPQPSTLVAALLIAATSLVFVPLIDASLTPLVAASSLALSMHAFVVTTILFALPTVLLASTSPIAIRLLATTTGHSGSTAGSVSAISTAGSIVGSVATAFFLIDWLRSINRTVLFVAAGTAIAAALVGVVSLRRGTAGGARRLALASMLVIVAIAVPTAAFVRSSRLDRDLLRPTPGTKVLFVGESPYHRLTVRDRLDKVREITFDATIQSRMPIGDPAGPGFDFTDAMHVPRLFRPQIKRVLVIGLGGGTAPKQYLRWYPDVEVDVVDIDPLVIDVAKRYFDVVPSERLRLYVADGRQFVERSREKWDLIILDAYTTNRYGAAIPPHLVTTEFFGSLRDHLNPGGIVYFHCGFGALRRAVHKTMANVFPYVGRMEGEFIASHTAFLTPKELLQQRASIYGPALPTIRRQIEILTFDPPPVADVPLLTDDFAPVDTLLGRR